MGGVLVKDFTKRDGTGSVGQMIIPRDLKKEVLKQMHVGIMSGHMGTKKT